MFNPKKDIDEFVLEAIRQGYTCTTYQTSSDIFKQVAAAIDISTTELIFLDTIPNGRIEFMLVKKRA